MNEYDSARIVDLLIETHNIERVNIPEEADILLLNTCSIREKAQEKVFSDLGRWRKLKATKPNLIIGVGGCVASQEGKKIIQRAPFVDIVFGPQTLHRLPQMIREIELGEKASIDISFPAIEKFDNLPEPHIEGPTAFVSIMEGCNNFCSYCIVPYTRGREFSRSVNEVLKEVTSLAKQNVREITLLGQNVNNYQGLDENNNITDLATLIQRIAPIEGIGRIRFMSSHPCAFSDALIETYAQIPTLANHLHLPVQSGSDRILAAMRRKYTALEFKSKINKLRLIRPDISVSSDFIVGFPGETDEDFEQTLQLVREIGFDHSFSFIYSPRPGTQAEKLADNVTLSEKKNRLETLQTLLNASTHQMSESMVGTTQNILVDGFSKKNEKQYSGRTENNRVVNFDDESTCIGQFVNVQITEALPNSLRGKRV